MLSLGERELDLFQLLKQVKYQPSDLHSGRLKHISLPQCTNKEARASFETALCGVFSECVLVCSPVCVLSLICMYVFNEDVPNTMSLVTPFIFLSLLFPPLSLQHT